MTLMLSQLTLSKLKKRFHFDRNQTETFTHIDNNSSNRSTASISTTGSSVQKNYYPLSSAFRKHKRGPTRTASALVATLFLISSFQNYHHCYQVRAMSTNPSSNVSVSTGSTSTTSSQPPAAALIFLHGLGDTPAGWSSLSSQLPLMKPSLANIQYVFPPAPTIPISINGGMKMPGWFDLYDWPIAVGCQHDHDGLGKAVQSVEEFVRKLESQGIPKNRIVIGGFSQGGAVALRTVYHHDAKHDDEGNQDESSSNGSSRSQYAACVNLSGWLTFDHVSSSSTSSSSLSSSTSSSNHHNQSCMNVPLFWGHGSLDDKVLFEQQSYGVNKLVTEMNLKNVYDYSYPIGHGAHPEEMVMLAEFLDKVLFGNGENDDETSDK
jgi:lysophospholipase-2